ncbi:hypothetical protein CK203_114312 [Vitis vinifera]|uniref:Cytokinin dehydrogenase 1 FAD/cytokinin binding domain-containing protein n=1 Tax=Vitis vinifera TaxID=29760 RepID=A0A438C9I9_VITVI|nr:hypothetical protein CK203_114312 [Vitis vinifera]
MGHTNPISHPLTTRTSISSLISKNGIIYCLELVKYYDELTSHMLTRIVAFKWVDEWEPLENQNKEILQFCDQAGIKIKGYLPAIESWKIE